MNHSIVMALHKQNLFLHLLSLIKVTINKIIQFVFSLFKHEKEARESPQRFFLHRKENYSPINSLKSRIIASFE
ncbi:hypothetical protein CEF21_21450 [Bacillus sp. FJAT-42376]|nr:hypothetical protein CEF21_21450 [Bacillus sp. FJAT-42376]